ncbi:MAG: aldo/keto reductase, partial [Chitinophagaceae bacterium]
VGRGLSNGAIQQEDISPEVLSKIKRLNAVAQQRQQSLAQMAIAWLLKDKRVTSVLVGASSVGQLENNLACLSNLHFSVEELNVIEAILKA